MTIQPGSAQPAAAARTVQVPTESKKFEPSPEAAAGPEGHATSDSVELSAEAQPEATAATDGKAEPEAVEASRATETEAAAVPEVNAEPESVGHSGAAHPEAAAVPHSNGKADSVELSAAAQRLVQAWNGPNPQQAQKLAALYASAKGMVSANPGKARSSLQNIISQYPNSPEAQKARVQLAQLVVKSQ